MTIHFNSYCTPSKWRQLSNFFPCLCYIKDFSGEIIQCKSVESAYQALKLRSDEDRLAVGNLSGREAKLWMKTQGFTHSTHLVLAPDWMEKRHGKMTLLLRQKYDPKLNPSLCSLLVDETGEEELIHSNKWHDNVWGVCECENCKMRDSHSISLSTINLVDS